MSKCLNFLYQTFGKQKIETIYFQSVVNESKTILFKISGQDSINSKKINKNKEEEEES